MNCTKELREPEKTDWFPASIHPVRDGVYQVDTGFPFDVFSMYKNNTWFCCGESILDALSAYESKEKSEAMYLHNSKWRGLTNEYNIKAS